PLFQLEGVPLVRLLRHARPDGRRCFLVQPGHRVGDLRALGEQRGALPGGQAGGCSCSLEIGSGRAGGTFGRGFRPSCSALRCSCRSTTRVLSCSRYGATPATCATGRGTFASTAASRCFRSAMSALALLIESIKPRPVLGLPLVGKCATVFLLLSGVLVCQRLHLLVDLVQPLVPPGDLDHGLRVAAAAGRPSSASLSAQSWRMPSITLRTDTSARSWPPYFRASLSSPFWLTCRADSRVRVPPPALAISG